jgi:hypothetical protein
VGLGTKKEYWPVSEYVFKLKKGDLELELSSDDAQFIETQMEHWRQMLIREQTAEASAAR